MRPARIILYTILPIVALSIVGFLVGYASAGVDSAVASASLITGMVGIMVAFPLWLEIDSTPEVDTKYQRRASLRRTIARNSAMWDRAIADMKVGRY